MRPERAAPYATAAAAVAPSGLASLARRSAVLPLAAAGLGTLAPGAAVATAHAILPFAVPLLVVLAVLATEMTPLSGREAGTALLMLLVTALICPLIVAGLAAFAGLPRDLIIAATVVAAAPVALGAGVLSQGMGLPGRPAIWAAMLGLLAGPLVLPAAAALCGAAANLIDPWRLACRGALSGAAPALAALAVRRAAPHAIAAKLPALRGSVVLALLLPLFAAGAALHAAAVSAAASLGTAVSDAAAALAVSLGTLGACAVVGALVGRLAAGRVGSLSLAVAGGARNASFVWAATVGALSPRADLVLAVAVVAAFGVPTALCAAASVRSGAQRFARRRGNAGQGSPCA